MEAEKKRKRGESGEVDGGEGRKKKTDTEVMKRGKAEAVAPTPPPTEEEVEEFFAILRRMHVAVKYFERSNGNGDDRKLMALEAEVLGGVDDVKVGQKRVDPNVVLDLNAVPEE